MKLKLFFTGMIFTFLSFVSHGQTKVGDVTLPNSFTAGKDILALNGGGIREKFWMDMYVGGLYLTAKNKDAATIVSGNSSMAIKIHIVSSLISSSRMTDAVEEGFKKSTGNNTTPYKDKIEQFKKAFSDPIKVGDVFDIVYSAEKISIYKNNTLKTEIEGFDFKKAVFGIWLGSNPADEDLKKGMLGE